MTEPGGVGIHFPFAEREQALSSAPDLPATAKKNRDPGRLTEPVTALSGIGRVRARQLEDLGIETIGDLLLHLPFRHETPARLTPILHLTGGEIATVRGRVTECVVKKTRRRNLKILEALVNDGSGTVRAIWYNQDYLEEALSRRPEVLLRGRLRLRGSEATFVVKSHELVDDGDGEEGLHTLGLVPVYPAMGDLSVRVLRRLLSTASREAWNVLDPLPARMKAELGLAGKKEALLACHYPRSLEQAEQARRRLAFEELLLLQIALLERRRAGQAQPGYRLGAPKGLAAGLLERLPYRATKAQERVIAEIDADLGQAHPMQRLLQGDVGSGKTVVATYALLRAVESGGQAAFLVPTEVLAEQHVERLSAQLRPLGVRVGLLTGSRPAEERADLVRELADGELPIVVGTHALIQEGIRFRSLRVVVVDEQHRFGVRQREVLASQADGAKRPHVLHMTATPIPRTLSLTLYGDLDVSTIDELPAGRRPVETRLVGPEDAERMWALVRRELDQGHRVFVVCPVIEETGEEGAVSVKTAYDRLARTELAGYAVRMLHGRLPHAEKQGAMQEFAGGDARVLVTTTVIEVGVDVPSATVLVVLGARRFGLSQLHQLRGRVGRSARRSYCFLLRDGGEDEDTLRRLEIFQSTTDGFRLAEADLRLRGEGQLFGERQAGFGDLRVAGLLRDQQLLQQARAQAEEIVEEDPQLEDPRVRLLGEASREQFGERSAWLDRA